MIDNDATGDDVHAATCGDTAGTGRAAVRESAKPAAPGPAGTGAAELLLTPEPLSTVTNPFAA